MKIPIYLFIKQDDCIMGYIYIKRIVLIFIMKIHFILSFFVQCQILWPKNLEREHVVSYETSKSLFSLG